MTQKRARRWFLRSAALATATGLAGCSEDADGSGGTTRTPTSTRTPTPTPTERQTEEQPQVDPEVTEADRQTPVADPQQAVDDWLSPAGNYDGDVVDRTGETSTTIDVGVETPNRDYFAYGPPAVAVTVGAQVRWLWTGEGGAHSVTERTGAFDSGSPKSSGTFTHEFADPGVYLYRCRNHGGSIGMRGAVVVRERQSLSGYPKVDEWFEGYDYDYDGRLDDRRGETTVTVTAGASGNGGNFAFDPNAILVSRGTEIVFDWSGRGGAHQVTWEDGDLPDSDSTASASHTYSVTMNESGVYRYLCHEHKPTGGRGAVVVA